MPHLLFHRFRRIERLRDFRLQQLPESAPQAMHGHFQRPFA